MYENIVSEIQTVSRDLSPGRCWLELCTGQRPQS